MGQGAEGSASQKSPFPPGWYTRPLGYTCLRAGLPRGFWGYQLPTRPTISPTNRKMRPSNTTRLQASVLAQYGLLLHPKQHPLYLHSSLDLVPIPALTTLFLSTPVSYSSQHSLPTSNWVPFGGTRSTGTPEDFASLSFQVGEAIVCCRCLLPGQYPTMPHGCASTHPRWLALLAGGAAPLCLELAWQQWLPRHLECSSTMVVRSQLDLPVAKPPWPPCLLSPKPARGPEGLMLPRHGSMLLLLCRTRRALNASVGCGKDCSKCYT